MSIFNHFGHISLTNDQHKAVEAIQTFLESDTDVFILNGYAGSGKTTLLKGVCGYLNSLGQIFSLFAPTGRAAMILKQKTGFDASTIHRGIYNFDELFIDEKKETFKYYYGLHQNDENIKAVYLIDEASMVSDYYSDDEFFRFGSGHLLSDLMKFVFEGNNNRKIIFIGDNAQLPPISMNFSPALDENYLKKNLKKNIISVEMTEVVRQQSESGILQTATKIRQSLEKREFNSFFINNKYKDIELINPSSFLEIFASSAKQNRIENQIVITHSNKQALEYNLIIKKLRYKTEKTELQHKDILIITKNNYNYQIELYNGMFVTVVEVGEIIRDEIIRFKVKGGDLVNRRLVFRELIILIKENTNTINLKCLVLDNFLTVDEGRLHPYDQVALFVDFKNRHKGLKPRTKEFKDTLKTDRFFNALQVKYGYAVTCHKSQGGEWQNVFVDFKVFIGKSSAGFFRWAYTAITRSSEKMFSIDAPEYNALSQFVVLNIGKLSRIDSKQYYIAKENKENFVEYRVEKIKKESEQRNIIVQFKHYDNQILVEFDENEEFCKVQLWYGNDGFTKTIFVSCPDDKFRGNIEILLNKSLLPESEIKFISKFSFQEDLHNYLLEIFNELDIKITNIIQKEWSDKYYIQTKAQNAFIEFYFNSKYIYTKAEPKTSLGNDDELMKSIIEKFRS